MDWLPESSHRRESTGAEQGCWDRALWPSLIHRVTRTRSRCSSISTRSNKLDVCVATSTDLENVPLREKMKTMKCTAQCHLCKLKPHTHTKRTYILYRAAGIFRGTYPTIRVSVTDGERLGLVGGEGIRGKIKIKSVCRGAWNRERTVVGCGLKNGLRSARSQV